MEDRQFGPNCHLADGSFISRHCFGILDQVSHFVVWGHFSFKFIRSLSVFILSLSYFTVFYHYLNSSSTVFFHFHATSFNFLFRTMLPNSNVSCLTRLTLLGSLGMTHNETRITRLRDTTIINYDTTIAIGTWNGTFIFCNIQDIISLC